MSAVLERLTLFLSGDVMLGRGLDQILKHPSSPEIFEDYVRDARDYVKFAERVSGPIPRKVAPRYPFGDGLEELDRAAPFARIVNLETSVTTSDDYERGKGINYRMHPANVSVLTEARIDACVLANNHVLDWGEAGLLETLDTLQRVGIQTVGAGRSREEAERPIVIERGGPGRLVVFAMGSESSGVPRAWQASFDLPGVAHFDESRNEAVSRIAAWIAKEKRPSDIVMASLHWGSNWGYEVTQNQQRFAHSLIEAGVDIIHGHSSHHPRPIEVHEGKLVLYGCGDLLNDYEGIGGYEAYRGELSLLYVPTLEWATGKLVDLRMVPMRIEKMRLRRASISDARWLASRLDEVSRELGTRVSMRGDGALGIAWG